MTSPAVVSSDNGVTLGRKVREALIRDLKKNLSNVEGIVVTKMERVPTKDLNELRQALRNIEASFLVVKNSFARLVFKNLGWQEMDKLLKGSCGISPIRGDAAGTCKLLVKFAKDHEGFVLQGGLLEGQFLQIQDIASLARLPSREVLLARVAGGIQAPLAGLVGALEGIQRKLVGVIHAIFEKQNKGKND